MSVLIKMDFPKSCEECRFSRAFPVGEYDIMVKCTLLNRLIPFDGKPKRDDCPLIEIPTPHGRLIDANALIKKLGIGDLPIKLTYEINHAPTIIERETGD